MRTAPMIGPANAPDAADIGHQQHEARLRRADRLRVHDFEIDRRETARDAGEETGETEGDEAEELRRIADELRAFRIFAHRIAHASERRARDRVHRDHADEAPDRDEIIDLDLRAELVAEERRAAARGCR